MHFKTKTCMPEKKKINKEKKIKYWFPYMTVQPYIQIRITTIILYYFNAHLKIIS
jgi:hypothetical protein